jgi:hypothetical protein
MFLIASGGWEQKIQKIGTDFSFLCPFLEQKMYHEKSIEESKPASWVLLETNVSKKNMEA